MGFSHENHFTDTPYVGTESCLGSGCHDHEADDVLTIGHWKWQGIAANVVGVEGEVHGKNDFINNYCVAVPTNVDRCAQCHIGYGYIDNTLDFEGASKVDCLIQTDTYKKAPTTGRRLACHHHRQSVNSWPHGWVFKVSTFISCAIQAGKGNDFFPVFLSKR